MKIRNRRRLLVGLALATLLGACSYSIKIPFAADPAPAAAHGADCGVECDSSPTGGRSMVLRFLLGP